MKNNLKLGQKFHLKVQILKSARIRFVLPQIWSYLILEALRKRGVLPNVRFLLDEKFQFNFGNNSKFPVANQWKNIFPNRCQIDAI